MTAVTPDRIAQARSNWERAGWAEVAAGMTAVTSVMRLHRLFLTRVESVLQPWGLSFPRFELLRLLAFTRTGALPIGKASDRLQVHVTSVTSAMRPLVEAGLVTRTPHPVDRRTTLVGITDEGRRVVGEATLALNRQVFADLGLEPAALDQLIGHMDSMRRFAGDC